jgi:hypothetical protein
MDECLTVISDGQLVLSMRLSAAQPPSMSGSFKPAGLGMVLLSQAVHGLPVFSCGHPQDSAPLRLETATRLL